MAPTTLMSDGMSDGMSELDLDDIQGIIAGAYGKLRAASYVLLQIQDPAAARSWLRELAEEVRKASDGIPEAEPCVNIAFTYPGVEKLQLAAQALKGFERMFQEGMWNNKRRQRILGDTGESAPEHWHWGGPNNEQIDVLLLLFAAADGSLDELYESHRARFTSSGLEQVPGGRLDSHDLGNLEHFGFRDGVSQPKIAGLTRSTDKNNIVASGEFILGYPNGYGQFTDRPLLDPIHDQEGLLPRDVSGTDQKDLGRNGSYLVFRQMEQDVAGFWRFLDEATKAPDGTSDSDARDYVAAKMVGRWRSGTPLVRSPDKDDPTLARENAFLYHQDDRDGLKCPLGAHIRRTNPRDALPPPTHLLNPHNRTSDVIAVANRHRLMRRGRPYGEPLAEPLTPQAFLDNADRGGRRGLHFLCLNANINRQFEFVQNTWVNNPNFDRLYTDSDPLIGNRRDGGDTFTIPQVPVRKCVQGLPRFVEIRGGAYFFIPGIRSLRFLAQEAKELASPYAAPNPPASTGPPALSLRVMRGLNGMLEALRRLSRRRIFVPFRNVVGNLLKAPTVALAQFWINLRRPRLNLEIAGEQLFPGEEEVTQQVTSLTTAFLFRNYRDGIAERIWSPKTHGLVKARFEVLPDLGQELQVGIFQPGRSYPAWVRFGGSGPLAQPDIESSGVLSVKLMEIEGEKLLDDEKGTQDFICFGAPALATANILESLKLHRHIDRGTSLFYFVNPVDSRYPEALTQRAFTKALSNPLEARYWGCGANLFGQGRAVQYAFTPTSDHKTRIPWRPSDNYLREAMVKTLAQGKATFDVTVQFQTDPHRMPIEDSSVIWPEKLSPPVKVAVLRIPSQEFDSEAQLAFARNLSFNPWHARAEHRPLGSLNRSRKRVYLESAQVRQRINGEPHIEPTGEEVFE